MANNNTLSSQWLIWRVGPNVDPMSNVRWFNNYLQDQIDQRKPEAPKPNNRRTRGRATTTTPEPTYTAPDGTVHTGMTQEQFNESLMTQQMENDAYNNRRNATVSNGVNRQQIYQEAINRYRNNPESFWDREKDLLLSVGQQLGYSPENVAAQILWIDPNQATPAAQPAPASTSASQPVATPTSVAPSNAAWAGGRDEWQYATENDRKTQWGSNAIWFYL